MVRTKKSSATSPTSDRKSHDAAERVIDLDRYIPTVVSGLTTKLRNSAQIFFEQRFNITRLEWRIIAFLAAEGPSSAYDIWTMGSLDKAGVSRAVRSLEIRGLVTVKPVPKHTRRRTTIALTASGRKLNAETFEEIIKRHQRLLAGLTDADVEQFISVAKHLESRISEMDKEASGGSRFDPTKAPSHRGKT